MVKKGSRKVKIDTLHGKMLCVILYKFKNKLVYFVGMFDTLSFEKIFL